MDHKSAHSPHHPPRLYQRGLEVRNRMIQVALDVFGTRGYEGATTRMLAEQAGVSLPALPYYFGSKEGLYRAVAEHVADRLRDQMAPAISRAEAALAHSDLTVDEAVGVLIDVLAVYAGCIFSTDRPPGLTRFISRELVEPTAAFEILYQGFTRNVALVCTRLIARATGRTPDDAETRLRAVTILGQLLVFRMAEGAACRFLGWNEIADGQRAAISAMVRRQTEAILRDARDG